MTQQDKGRARKLRAEGKNLHEIAKDMARSVGGIRLHIVDVKKGSAISDPWSPRPDRLQSREREQIAIGLGQGVPLAAVATGLGRATSTVTREVNANGGRDHYQAFNAHDRARRSARRPKAAKLDHAPLVEQVTTWLEELWSPQEISARLRLEHPDDPDMHLSHETIYQSLYVQGRGELRLGAGPVGGGDRQFVAAATRSFRSDLLDLLGEPRGKSRSPPVQASSHRPR